MKYPEPIYLTEEEASPGFLCPDCVETIGIPLCNVCMSWDGPGKCKLLGTSPDEFRWGDRRDCPHAILNPKRLSYPRFAELYPEDVKRLPHSPPEEAES